MLNLGYIFDDATRAVKKYANFITIPTLPATVYLMQVDVINHYNHALDHYFTLTLKEDFLQNSSLGTPYEKWAYFTNQNFESLSFCIYNLIRYTHRLLSESERLGLIARKQVSTGVCSRYISNTVELRNKKIGINIIADERIVITAEDPDYNIGGTLLSKSENNITKRYFTPCNNDEEREISLEEWKSLRSKIREKEISISDRNILTNIKCNGKVEIEELYKKNALYVATCKKYYSSTDVICPFKELGDNWI
ncbi:hypothetical protein [Candidatus Uabimicrobium sp. HlEnr_7]|uniref:hypothetical protein n=1 Tax=Candidatus Uabimicrobium helgolandensis TaxID=3095367 RepID=UPI0035570173